MHTYASASFLLSLHALGWGIPQTWCVLFKATHVWPDTHVEDIHALAPPWNWHAMRDIVFAGCRTPTACFEIIVPRTKPINSNQQLCSKATFMIKNLQMIMTSKQNDLQQRETIVIYDIFEPRTEDTLLLWFMALLSRGRKRIIIHCMFELRTKNIII